ncbi:MAG TPA: hypothetical protein VHI13_21630 [Candidatus Kapabacteria bacterium]|nr:hypothetical protein [Candidatus Kapabacteria bacterium]
MMMRPPASLCPATVLLLIIVLVLRLGAQERRPDAANDDGNRAAGDHRANTLGEDRDTVNAIHPLLTTIFFEEGSAGISERYVRLAAPDLTRNFTDTTIAGGTLEHYHNVLNIIGYRMRVHPSTTIEIGGSSSREPRRLETAELAAMRAGAVRAYLVKVWGIDTARIRMLPTRRGAARGGFVVDPLAREEDRCAEIRSADWEIVKPVVVSAIRAAGGSGADDGRYRAGRGENLVRQYAIPFFTFTEDKPGAVNARVLREFICNIIHPDAHVECVGHNDIIGLEDWNLRLSEFRANIVMNFIKHCVGSGRAASIAARGVGESQPLYPNALPEGRCYNRTVLVTVSEPAAADP